MIITKQFDNLLIKNILGGGIGVLPTDTLYGIVGLALSKKTVKKIYKLRKRNFKKPMIILIGSINQLNLFKIKVDKKTKRILNKFWPGKVSIVLLCNYKKFLYLHRGTKTLAFRLPDNFKLRKLLIKTGPLVAPTANFEGKKPAANIKEAKKYFYNRIDFYVDWGKLTSLPSTLIKIEKGQVSILRKGAVKISNNI